MKRENQIVAEQASYLELQRIQWAAAAGRAVLAAEQTLTKRQAEFGNALAASGTTITPPPGKVFQAIKANQSSRGLVGMPNFSWDAKHAKGDQKMGYTVGFDGGSIVINTATKSAWLVSPDGDVCTPLYDNQESAHTIVLADVREQPSLAD